MRFQAHNEDKIEGTPCPMSGINFFATFGLKMMPSNHKTQKENWSLHVATLSKHSFGYIHVCNPLGEQNYHKVRYKRRKKPDC